MTGANELKVGPLYFLKKVWVGILSSLFLIFSILSVKKILKLFGSSFLGTSTGRPSELFFFLPIESLNVLKSSLDELLQAIFCKIYFLFSSLITLTVLFF